VQVPPHVPAYRRRRDRVDHRGQPGTDQPGLDRVRAGRRYVHRLGSQPAERTQLAAEAEPVDVVEHPPVPGRDAHRAKLGDRGAGAGAEPVGVHPPAQPAAALQHLDPVAEPLQLPRRGQPGDTGAENGDRAAVLVRAHGCFSSATRGAVPRGCGERVAGRSNRDPRPLTPR
jgi:hypothetical protein